VGCVHVVAKKDPLETFRFPTLALPASHFAMNEFQSFSPETLPDDCSLLNRSLFESASLDLSSYFLPRLLPSSRLASSILCQYIPNRLSGRMTKR